MLEVAFMVVREGLERVINGNQREENVRTHSIMGCMGVDADGDC